MVAIELQSLVTGNRYLISLEKERGESITWPDHLLLSVEKVGDACSRLRFKQHYFEHDLLKEQSAFMRKSFSLNGEEVTTSCEEPSIQLLKFWAWYKRSMSRCGHGGDMCQSSSAQPPKSQVMICASANLCMTEQTKSSVWMFIAHLLSFHPLLPECISLFAVLASSLISCGEKLGAISLKCSNLHLHDSCFG
jgi:hypothetical protein